MQSHGTLLDQANQFLGCGVHSDKKRTHYERFLMDPDRFGTREKKPSYFNAPLSSWDPYYEVVALNKRSRRLKYIDAGANRPAQQLNRNA